MSFTMVADPTFTLEERLFGDTLRSAEELHLLALATLDNEYGEASSADKVCALDP